MVALLLVDELAAFAARNADVRVCPGATARTVPGLARADVGSRLCGIAVAGLGGGWVLMGAVRADEARARGTADLAGGGAEAGLDAGACRPNGRSSST